MNWAKHTFLIILFTFGLPTELFAASDPASATSVSSSGSSEISVNKGESFRVTGLSDFMLVASSTAPNLFTDTVCIFSTSGSYYVRANSSNPDNTTFRMADTSPSPIFVNYDVIWNDGSGDITLGHNVKYGQDGAAATTPFANADLVSETCASTGGANAQLSVDVDNITYDAAPFGTYIDTLTIVISAN